MPQPFPVHIPFNSLFFFACELCLLKEFALSFLARTAGNKKLLQYKQIANGIRLTQLNRTEKPFFLKKKGNF